MGDAASTVFAVLVGIVLLMLLYAGILLIVGFVVFLFLLFGVALLVNSVVEFFKR